MAQGNSTGGGSAFTDLVSRLAWLCAIGAAIIISAVLVGKFGIKVLRVPTATWLVALVAIGPAIGVFLANAATIAGYYGTWRVLRRKAREEPSDDLKMEILSVPEKLRDLPEEQRDWLEAQVRRLGCRCQSIVVLSVLTVSLVAFALTQAHVLGATLTPVTLTSIRVTLANPTTTQGATDQVIAIGIYSDGSTRDLTTSVTWSSSDPSIATIDPRSGRATVAQQLGSNASTTITATSKGVRGSTILTVATPTPTPNVQFVVGPSTTTQTWYSTNPCFVDAYTVTLDNTKSNVAVGWQVTSVDEVPGTSSLWATASPASGIVPAGETASFLLAPDRNVVCLPQTAVTYHATVDLTSGGTGSYVVSDTINPPIPIQ